MGSQNYAKDGQELRSNCPLTFERRRRVLGRDPGQAGYRELFTDASIASRRQSCDVHAGDWAVVLPAVTAAAPSGTSGTPMNFNAYVRGPAYGGSISRDFATPASA
jgi:hypothetical protein